MGEWTLQAKIMSSQPQDNSNPPDNTSAIVDVPIPPFINLVWDSPHIHEYVDFDGNAGWKCGHCNKSWKGKNHTKALTHLTGVGKDIAPCKGRIPEPWRLLYHSLVKKNAEKKSSKIARERDMQAELDERDRSTAEQLLSNKVRRSNSSSAASSSRALVDLCHSPDLQATTKARTITTVAPAAKKPKHFQTNIVVTRGKNNPEAERNLDVAISHFILANCLPLSLAEDELLNRILVCAQQTNNRYKPPHRMMVSGTLLEATFSSYVSSERSKLDIDAEKFGITVYGDGCKVQRSPLFP
jgi:hypothetical protein